MIDPLDDLGLRPRWPRPRKAFFAVWRAQFPRSRSAWLVYVVVLVAVGQFWFWTFKWLRPWLPGGDHGPGFFFGFGLVTIIAAIQVTLEYLNPRSRMVLPAGQRRSTVILVIACLLVGVLLVYAAYRWPPA